MSDEIISQVELVDIDLLKPNQYNPNEMTDGQFQALVDDIKENGFVAQPIVINQHNEIINGEHRWKASKLLGYSQVPIVRFNPVDEDHQKMLTIGWNTKHGDFNPTKLAQIIVGLNQRYTLDELSSHLGFSQEQLKDKLAISEVTQEFIDNINMQAEIRQNEIPTTINFAVTKEQESTILEALDYSQGKTKGERLQFICRAFLLQKLDEK
jgi:ParB family chromosome partitioning protein